MLLAAVLAIVVFQKMKPKQVETPPDDIQKTNQEKQKDSLGSLTAPEKSQGNQDEKIAPEALKNAKESLTALETSSDSNNQTGGAPVSQKVLDYLNAK